VAVDDRELVDRQRIGIDAIMDERPGVIAGVDGQFVPSRAVDGDADRAGDQRFGERYSAALQLREIDDVLVLRAEQGLAQGDVVGGRAVGKCDRIGAGGDDASDCRHGFGSGQCADGCERDAHCRTAHNWSPD